MAYFPPSFTNYLRQNMLHQEGASPVPPRLPSNQTHYEGATITHNLVARVC